MTKEPSPLDQLAAVEALQSPTIDALLPYVRAGDPLVVTTALRRLNDVAPAPHAELEKTLLSFATDAEDSVRALSAQTVLRFLPEERAVPVLINYCSFKNSDVKLSALHLLYNALDTLAPESIVKIIEQLCRRVSDSEWRVRHVVQLFIPAVVALFGDCFLPKLQQLVKIGLLDNAQEVRKQAIKTLAELVGLNGQDWGKEVALPLIINLYTHPNYKIRQSSLEAMVEVGVILGKDTITSAILPMMLNSAFDLVSNVRFAFIQNLSLLLRKDVVDQNVVVGRVLPALVMLLKDVDQDVAAFSKRLVSEINPE